MGSMFDHRPNLHFKDLFMVFQCCSFISKAQIVNVDPNLVHQP